tara:strand:+ start:676 stop:876 length:201 start_codon:yes stop_codon:yes gene_type:complete
VLSSIAQAILISEETDEWISEEKEHVNEETETLVGEAYPPPAAQKGLSDLILSKFITLINIGSDED